MKLLAIALSLVLSTGDAFSPINLVSNNARSTVVTSSTSLKNGMDAYDQQMRAMASGASATATAVPAPAADNFKSSPRWRKKTKQLATLGPASSSFEMIEKLFLAGADVFRLNFSHGEHAQKKELLDIIRSVEAKYDHPIAILGDLQGPKLRVSYLGVVSKMYKCFHVHMLCGYMNNINETTNLRCGYSLLSIGWSICQSRR